MEQVALVTRVPKRKGHPFTEVKATAKGQELCNQAKEKDLAHIRKIMSCLSAEEIQQLTKLLRKIRESALEELHVELLAGPNWTRV
jgi:DNA-binding MarR family transcriptional regulator